mgnify:CR=1 FL=1
MQAGIVARELINCLVASCYGRHSVGRLLYFGLCCVQRLTRRRLRGIATLLHGEFFVRENIVLAA